MLRERAVDNLQNVPFHVGGYTNIDIDNNARTHQNVTFWAWFQFLKTPNCQTSGELKMTSSKWTVQYRHLSKTNTLLCPFRAHTRDVWLYSNAVNYTNDSMTLALLPQESTYVFVISQFGWNLSNFDEILETKWCC